MATTHTDLQSLPLNFPETFLPERRLLASLLRFSVEKGVGNKMDISEETGIPTGESSGKVEPMIHYAFGMGLIFARKKSACWKMEPTILGRLIFTEDPNLSEPVTLWLLHLLLCRRKSLEGRATGLADAWFALFADGTQRIGNRFDQATFREHLTERHGVKGYLKGLSGLVPRSYLQSTCFGSINALSEEETPDGQTFFLRRPAPADSIYFPAYSACLFLAWDALFAGQNQLAIEDLLSQSRCLAVMGLDRLGKTRWIDWMADHHLLQLDRQTGDVMALRQRDTATVIAGLFDELI